MKTIQSEIELLSKRIRNYRIDCEMTQRQLADQSGVSLRSLQRFEKGEDIQLGNLIKILHALGIEQNLKMLVPDVTGRPSAYVGGPRERQRVRTPNRVNRTMFKWGDEE